MELCQLSFSGFFAAIPVKTCSMSTGAAGAAAEAPGAPCVAAEVDAALAEGAAACEACGVV